MQPRTEALEVNHLLSCPACATSEFSNDGSFLVCGRCGARHALRNGVVDFVGGRQETSLDAIDYDGYYGVDESKIAKVFELVDRHAGPILRRSGQTVLELGSGTGLLTSGLVRHESVERLLVTDLSPKMLAACRERLRALAPGTKTELCFATNDGVTLGARPGAFDLAVGYFVVHHILDWQKTLSAVFAATNGRGAAVFVEPNRRFHLALTLVMTRVLERLLPEMPDLPGSDLSSLLNLNSEWDFTLKYADQPSALAGQEDKHFFERGAFERAARAAGWAFTKTFRFDSGTGPLETAKVYAAQLKLSPKGTARFIDVLLSELPGPFSLLDDTDASPSYVFFLAKRKEDADLCPSGGGEPSPSRIDLEEPPNGYGMVYDLRVELTKEPPYWTIEGWIAATRPVMRVVFWLGDLRGSAVVGGRRVDVVRGMSRLRRHPFTNLLHSGVRAIDALESGFGNADPTEKLRVAAELDDGNRVTIAEGRRLERAPSGAWRARIFALD